MLNSIKFVYLKQKPLITMEVIHKPDYIFETSWEVCNKVGGIHTVISTKALTWVNEIHDNLIFIGPDVWKDSSNNPEFIEDKQLFKSWRDSAQQEGLRIKVGRWNINGKPVVILVDFSTFIPQKDRIFEEFWNNYKLDSLTGQWDYIEPMLFGYAAAKVIESFYNFYLLFRQNVVAQFHEWMTGSGGLYLKTNVPKIANVFTTHATVLGRCIAGNGLPLYDQLETYAPDEIAKRFNVVAKQSLEQVAAQEADCFTTVSDITARECAQFLKQPVHLVTPNGFENTFVPEPHIYENKRKEARAKLLSVAEAVMNQKLSDDVLMISTSGRYEFHNKGIDVFIDALGKLNHSADLKQNVLAFILVPAGHYGPRKDVLNVLNREDFQNPYTHTYLTHELHNIESDPAIKQLYKNSLFNMPNDKVKLIFVPSYLNGDDGMFNMPYYDVLTGMDLTIYPSYYEPWGYTPMESVAFHIPTITTSLAGFGAWISDHNKEHDSVSVIARNDENDAEVSDKITQLIANFSKKTKEQVQQSRVNAKEMADTCLWREFINYYKTAYSIALANKGSDLHLTHSNTISKEPISTHNTNMNSEKPNWKKIFIKPSTPDALKNLYELVSNLWWCWDHDATELIKSIDEERFIEHNFNPIALLNNLSFDQIQKLENDKEFLKKLHAIYERFQTYMAEKPAKGSAKIAYFSMEFGLHASLKIYSGGLGILAGDYLKQASDSNYDLVAIGLLYRTGYFKQRISLTGEQEHIMESQQFTMLPTHPVRDNNGNWIKISINYPGRTVFARVWVTKVGKISLYLLDTDIDDNAPEDRHITNQLYGGNNEHRLKQEIMLGIGGIRTLDAIGIKADLYHSNEGHAAFLTLERLKKLIHSRKLTFNEASEIVKNSTLFTTHTPVPAGHDSFTEDLIRTYLPHYADKLTITWEEFMNLGRTNPNIGGQHFSMSNLAIRLCSEVNGVSRLHGAVTRDMFKHLWPGYMEEELHIGHVTNGVHYPTWMARRWKDLYDEHLGTDMVARQSEHKYWEKIQDVDDAKIWDIKEAQRKDLLDHIRHRVEIDWAQKQEDPKRIIEFINKLDDNTLTIGFARRFATYKRAYLLFKNLDRLSAIVNNPKQPVQFVFAGKAHPNDGGGQGLIKMISEISKRPEFLGKIIFLEGYEMELAKKLVQGVDVWLNTPTRPLEASGTSGQKTIINGVLNFSVLDGWWCEGYKSGAGWCLKEENTYDNSKLQDELDAETIYSIIEHQIVPLYYKREKNIPKGWVKYMKNSIAEIAPEFNTKRMIDEYYVKYYSKLGERNKAFKKDDCKLAKELVLWKKHVLRNWNDIEVIDVSSNDTGNNPLKLGDIFHAEVQLNLRNLNKEDVHVEILFIKSAKSEVKSDDKIILKQDLNILKTEGSKVTYVCDITTELPGVYNYIFRLSPINKNIPHRMDFDLVKWI